MAQGTRWSEDELLLALHLYFKLPFGQQHSSNPDIKRLADRLGRTPGSVNMKLNNFAAIDPELNREGLTNYSETDKEVWDEYWQDLDRLASVSETIHENLIKEDSEKSGNPDTVLSRAREAYGTEKTTSAKRRMGQKFFRDVLLAHYNSQCAVCRLQRPGLLDAAHIVDWKDADDRNLRVDPRNGILLCAIHHRAFDSGDLTIVPDEYTIQVSEELQREDSVGAAFMFHRFAGEQIVLPERFKPRRAYLERVR